VVLRLRSRVLYNKLENNDSQHIYLHEFRLCRAERVSCLFSMAIIICYHSFQQLQPYIAIIQAKKFIHQETMEVKARMLNRSNSWRATTRTCYKSKAFVNENPQRPNRDVHRIQNDTLWESPVDFTMSASCNFSVLFSFYVYRLVLNFSIKIPLSLQTTV
jgi:hypothetical protein